MRLRDLAEPYPTATLDTAAVLAVTAMAQAHRPGLIVLDRKGRPYAVLPGPKILRAVVPGYIQEDPALARVVEADAAERVFSRLSGMTVRDLIDPERDLRELPVLQGDDTTMEAAALMAEHGIHLVAVTEHRRLLGALTVSHLLRHFLDSTGPR